MPKPAQAPIVPRFLATHANVSTTSAYAASLRDFGDFLRTTDERGARRLLGAGMTGATELANRYRAWLERRKKSPATRRLRLVSLRAFCSWARGVGLIDWPLEYRRVKHQPYRDTRGPSMTVVRKLFAHLGKDKSPTGRRDLAIVHLLFDLALRRMEPTLLDVAHVVDDRLMVAGKGRGGERIPITLPPRTRAAIKAWLRVRPRLNPNGGALFVDTNGARMTPRQVYDLVRAAGDEIGEKLKTHGLRHAAITEALERTKGNVRTVRHFSRHTDIDTLLKYDDNRVNQGGKIAALVARRT
jgi:integrase/recombinase XerC